jgi:hypothetical protein
MFDYNKVSDSDLSQLKQIASKAAEKSPLEQEFYLYSQSPVEKARIFLFCQRFLISLANLLDDGDLQTEIKRYANENQAKYLKLNAALSMYDEPIEYGKDHVLKHIMDQVFVDDVIDNMIDLFSILLEKASVIQLSKLKAIVMEGKSGENFKKIFNQETVEEP